MIDEKFLREHGEPLSEYLAVHGSPHIAIVITDSMIKVVEEAQGIKTKHGDHSE